MSNHDWSKSLVQHVESQTSDNNTKIIRLDTNEPQLTGYSYLLSRIEQEFADLEKYEFIDEDDRKHAKTSRAEVNKIAEAFKKTAKNAINEYINKYNEQVKEIVDRLYELSNEYKLRLDQFDDAYRADKLEQIKNEYNTLTRDNPLYENIELDYIYDIRWLNRTAALKTVTEAMETRLRAIIDFMDWYASIPDEPELTVHDVSIGLNRNNWEFNGFMRETLRKREARIEQEKIAEKLSTAEPEKIETRLPKRQKSFVVTVPIEDVNEFTGLMREHSWSTKQID